MLGENILSLKFLSSVVKKNPVTWKSNVFFSNVGKGHYKGHWIY